MGNCQAIDNASLVLQTQNGRAERYYSPVSAAEIMKLHPGHHVALLLTTTFYSSPPPSSNINNNNNNNKNDNNNDKNDKNATNTNQQPLRVTRIKLLRPTDNLVLGHAYRLITNQEVMKGLKAKKNGKLNNNKDLQPRESALNNETNSDCETTSKRANHMGKTYHQV
ncbi:hypothetical protein CTI12_AA461830 [Artemisia annua]|uniref:Uncharacterized protein n=1 Tax=Artemisia annua TaxID=35608 RepID=A0A2U1LRN3_ARTAN|nr:hypothetical protein CTI12_AA461830 [Artemisia annua]